MAYKDNTRAQVARIGKCKKVVIANVVWRTVLVPCGYLGFCHYECSEVIQKQLLLAMRLLLSLCSISSDKKRRQKLRVTMKKNKIPRKTTFLNIKVHLKLSCNSVGQGRGGLEGPCGLRNSEPGPLHRK